MDGPAVTRRPIRARGSRWASHVARWLTDASVTPNQISIAGAVFACAAGALLLAAARLPAWPLFLLSAACMELRLLCNLFDGMVAIEGGLKTRSGEVFNDLPDRLSDTAIFLAAGYAVPSVGWGPELGWAAALLAALTAYVRLLGGASGLPQRFSGPMAKQHRMAVMIASCLAAAAVEVFRGPGDYALVAGLSLVAGGSAVTVALRAVRLVRDLEAKAP